MQGQFTRLGAAMEAARAHAPMQNRPEIYRNQLRQVADLRSGFNQLALASGQFHTQTVQTISASERFTNSIRQQKVGLMQAGKEYRNYRNAVKTGSQSILGEAIKSQQALRNSMSTQWTGNAFGKNSTDLYIPKNLGGQLDDIRTKYGMINRMLYSAARNTVNWGKNTQWAGRQVMVGLTVPLGMLAVGAAAVAKQVDQGLTRVAKVYDTTATTAEGRERELAQLRENGLTQATQLAKEYGMALEDTINIQGQLAAIGKNGSDLFQSTKEVSRFATLGDIDTQTAIDATIALQTAFRDTIPDAKALADTFNYMNAVENGTSLQMKDIAEAIPRAASAMAALGVDAKEMTVMLVAMREAGVDAAEAANALKTGATKILDPTPDAVKAFDKVGIKLEDLVTQAKGNMFEFIKVVSQALHGLPTQEVQTAIAELFGAYQFNRDTALITNMGDAMAGLAGEAESAGTQTQKAMELMGQSAEKNAAAADREMEQLQNSISFKFNVAVQNIKAALVPFGETALQVATTILDNFITPILNGFNNLPGPIKTGIMVLMGLGAAAGVLMMVSGIMANLFGSLMGMGLQLGNLRFKFKALSADEQAAAIQSKTATSVWNTEAAAAANLATQVQLLTKAFEQNAFASGMMMNAQGQMMANGHMRTVQKVQSTGTLVYGAGSRDATGRPIAGHPVASVDDARRFQQIERASANTATNTQRARISMQGVGKAIGIATAGIATFAAIAAYSGDSVNHWAQIAMYAAMVASLLPMGFWTGAVSMIGKMGAGIAGWFRGGSIGTIGTTIRSWGPVLARVGMTALRVFGPIGILATGALITKQIYDNMNAMEDAQKSLATTSKNWAEIIGYTDTPGALPGLEEEDQNTYERRIENVNKLRDANEDFVETIEDAAKASDNYGRLYDIAMQQALRAVSRGANAEQAGEIFATIIQTAVPDQAVVDKLTVRFEREGIDLENPDDVRERLQEIINDQFSQIPVDVTIRPNRGRELLGGDLTSEMRSLGEASGQALLDAFNAAGKDKAAQAEAFNGLVGQSNRVFKQMVDDAKKNVDGLGALMSKMGIKTADELAQAIEEADDAYRNHKATDDQKKLVEMYWDNEEIDNFMQSYQEWLDTIVQGWADASNMSEEDAKKLRDAVYSIFDFKGVKVGDVPDQAAKKILNVSDAQKLYEMAMQDSVDAGEQLSDSQKLATLNFYRAQAGLAAVTDVAQGFGDAALEAARDTKQLSNAIQGVTWDANAMMQMTPGDLSGAMQNAYQGAYQEILGEAERQYQEHRQVVVDNLQKEADDRDKAYDQEEKGQDKHYDELEKQTDAYWEGQEKDLQAKQKQDTKAAESYWDSIEKAAQDAADAEDKAFDDRIQAIQDTIDAEQKAEDQRQKIFEAEQARIERMASRLNTNIDFNVALNSGNLDEAAKIANDAAAREQSWSMDDANANLGSAVERRRSELEAQIESIQSEKDARSKWHQERMDQIKAEREAALETLQAQQAADQENLRINRQNDEERVKSAREAAKEELATRREATRQDYEASIKAEEDKTEVQTRELATRLRVLQEFIPTNEQELRDHVAEVESVYQDYGVVLKGNGEEWSGYIGETLKGNIDASAAALQTQINWNAIAKNIASQLGEGFGMSLNQVTEFLKTGNWPAGMAPEAPQYKPNINVAPGADNRVAGQNGRVGGIIRHSGGEVGHDGGGPGWSQADRVGVPRSASRYPSEVPILAKAGEFVVKAQQARKHRGLLESINNGEGKFEGTPRHAGGDIHANDIGGTVPIAGTLAEVMTGYAALAAMVPTMVTAMVAKRKLQQGQDAYFASMSGGYIDDGGGAIYQRLFSTIKRQFPRANLNSGLRNSNDYHGRGMAVDLGEEGFAGGAGRPYLASMNRWIYDSFPMASELIYNGLGDDRPNLKNGRDYAYSAATQAQHRNHVHWAMTQDAIALANARGLTGPSSIATANGGIQQQVLAEAQRWGFGSGANWNALSWIIQHESSWNPNAQNNTSTASGLFQHIDGTWRSYRPAAASQYAKMRSAPVNMQAYAGMNYIKQRYGTPSSAQAFWQAHHWYDDGGFLAPGATMALNATGRPEPVFTADQWDILKSNIGNATYDLPGRDGIPVPVRLVDANVATGEQNVYDITIDLRGAMVKEEIDIQSAVEKAIDKREARNGRKRVIT